MSQLSSRLIALIVLAAVAAGVGLISKGTLQGKGDAGDPAAQQVIERALNNSNFRSGRFKASFNATFKGADLPAQLGNAVSANVSGAFNDRGSGKSPEIDMTLSMNVVRNIEFRVISTGREGFVSVGGRTYKATAADFQRMYGQVGRPQEQLGLAALGAQPRSWIRDATNEGPASIAGVATTHVSAEVDLDEMTDDLAALSRKYRQPGSQEISSEDAEKFKDAVENGRLDVYASQKDGSLRRATLHIDMEFDDGSGALDFAVDFSEVNKPQRIVAPPSALPFSQIDSDLANGAFSQLGGTAPSTGAGSTPAPTAGAPAATLPSEAQGYLGCVQRATSEPALARCSALLP